MRKLLELPVGVEFRELRLHLNGDGGFEFNEEALIAAGAATSIYPTQYRAHRGERTPAMNCL